jgi:uncharacterized Zn finger protein
MTSPQSSLILNVLEHVTMDRLQKAVETLAKDGYLIRFTTRTETEIGALVLNGDATEYSVVLTPGKAFCSCKDAMFRHVHCKHVAAVALYALRTPAEEQQHDEQEE